MSCGLWGFRANIAVPRELYGARQKPFPALPPALHQNSAVASLSAIGTGVSGPSTSFLPSPSHSRLLSPETAYTRTHVQVSMEAQQHRVNIHREEPPAITDAQVSWGHSQLCAPQKSIPAVWEAQGYWALNLGWSQQSLYQPLCYLSLSPLLPSLQPPFAVLIPESQPLPHSHQHVMNIVYFLAFPRMLYKQICVLGLWKLWSFQAG